MEPRQLKDGAAEAFARGRFSKAAELYDRYCASEPRDVQARLRLGDAWAKAGESQRAVSAYVAAAEAFARDGFLPRAIAASKLVLELAPEHRGVQEMLAGLYARRRGPGLAEPSPGRAVGPVAVETPTVRGPARSTPPAAPRSLAAGAGPLDLSLELQLEASGPAARRAASEPEIALSLTDIVPPAAGRGASTGASGPSAPMRPTAAPPGLGGSRAPSRIFIPTPEDPGAIHAPAIPGPRPRRDVQAGLQAFSRFGELDLELEALTQEGAPRPAAAHGPAATSRGPAASVVPAATEQRRTRFTELELDDASLLRTVEFAALAAQGAGPASVGADEETVFSITDAMDVDGPPTPGQLPRIPLFSDLSPEAFIELFERCPLRRFREGQRVLQQGTYGDAFYVICEGRVRVVREDASGARELAVLEGGAFFGEVALLSDAPRTASVDSAADDTQLLEISAPVLTELSHRYPAVAQALKKFCRERLLRTVMSTSALFRPFSRRDRRTIVERFRARDVPRGSVVLREGTRSDGLYVVLSGEVVVARDGVTLARLKEGEVFGEMSMLHGTHASATVTASRRTSLLRLPREDFDALVRSHPQFLAHVAGLSEDRQRQTEALLAAAADEDDLMLV